MYVARLLDGLPKSFTRNGAAWIRLDTVGYVPYVRIVMVTGGLFRDDVSGYAEWRNALVFSADDDLGRRVLGAQRATQWGYSLWELAVLGL